MVEGPLLLLLLLAAIVVIIVGTARLKAHPFLVLILTAYGLGLAAGLAPADTIAAITGGLGRTVGYIGIVIAAGTIIGTVLERSGAVAVMASAVIRWIGQARAVLAMSVTGAVISIPVFCDSGFVILAPLNRSLAARSGTSMATFAVALSMGLYATHVFVPPTPGPIAAAGELGADIGTVMILGLITTVPVLCTTYLFAHYIGRRIYIPPPPVAGLAEVAAAAGAGEGSQEAAPAAPSGPAVPAGGLPGVGRAFAPILIPVVLIAFKSFAELPGRPLGMGALAEGLGWLGDPNTALLLGVLLALFTARRHGQAVYGAWVGDGLRAAGTIILITGAGGALGSVLQATPIGDYLGTQLAAWELGAFDLVLPFLLAAALKTALGSSTVAIITTASIMAPLLPAMGLAEGTAVALATLAIGAGAMTVSHANDSYFWVVSQFSGMDVAQAYRTQTLGSAVAGVTGLATVLVMRFFMP